MYTYASRESKPNKKSSDSLPKKTSSGTSSSIRRSAEPLWATTRNLYNRNMIQASLKIGEANDSYEQEADRVADHIMRMPVPGVQRMCAECASGKTLCPKCAAEKKPKIQRWGNNSAGNMSVPDNFVSSLGRGRPLDPASRSFFEPRFGSDLGNVRVHTGSSAAESARSIGARAYTLGNNIVMGAGEYQPGTIQGKRLMAHELTHVMQQGGDRIISRAPLTDRCANMPTARPPLLIKDSVHPSVREAQTKLNLYHSQGNSLTSAPLVEDCIFGQLTYNAVLSFQKKVFPGLPNEHDGKIGPKTWAKLDAVTPTPIPPTPRTGVITSQTVATSPGGRTRTTIGVGEEVDLTYSLGSTTWTKTAGAFTFVAGNPTPTIRFTAPDTAQFVTITAGTASILFTIIAPNNVYMDREPGTGIRHTQNVPNCGIKTRPYLLPDNVNFYRVVNHEIDIPGVPTPGVYSCNPANVGHCGHGGSGPCNDIMSSNVVVAGKGTKTNGIDTAYSGSCSGSPPFTPGSLTISIPYEYKVGTGAFYRFATVTQYHALLPDPIATLVTTKAGALGMTWVSSPTSTY